MVVIFFGWCWCWCWCSSRRRPPRCSARRFRFLKTARKRSVGILGLDAFVATTNVSSSVENQSLLSLYFLLSFLRLCSARKYCSPKYACAFQPLSHLFLSLVPTAFFFFFLVIVVVVVVVVAGVPLSSVLVVARFSSSKFTIFFVFLRVFK